MTTINPTSKVKSYLDSKKYTYESMAKELGISVATLYTRLAKENWKRGELLLILNLK